MAHFSTKSDFPQAEELVFRATGLPIGSGAIESACKNVIQERSKCAYAVHTVGLRNLLAVRTTIINGRFNELWDNHIRREEQLKEAA